MEHFEISVEDADDAAVVAVRGEIDLDVADRFAAGLRGAVAEGRKPVVLDLCGVTFMDSTGLHLMLNLLRRLTRQKRRLAVACSGDGIRRLFEVTRLDSTFDLYASREEALAALV